MAAMNRTKNKKGMYHKMPLKNPFISQILSERHHNNNIYIFEFSKCCIFMKNRLVPFFHANLHANALSSKRQKKQRKEASYDTYPTGSITLEMVIVLPLFISFLVFFLFLFRVLLVQEGVEEALVYTARTLAIASYGEEPEDADTQAKLLAGAQLTFRKGLKEADCPTNFVRGGVSGISLLESQLTGDEVILRASYEMRVPCVLLGTMSYHLVQCVQSRKWIGNRSLSQDDRTDEQWVYITPYGTVYHCSRTCRYLDLSIRAVNRRELATLRSLDRRIYRRCDDCQSSEKEMCYVTDYGEFYHGSLSCKGLKRTIYMVKRSQVGGRHLCSKCGIRQ